MTAAGSRRGSTSNKPALTPRPVKGRTGSPDQPLADRRLRRPRTSRRHARNSTVAKLDQAADGGGRASTSPLEESAEAADEFEVTVGPGDRGGPKFPLPAGRSRCCPARRKAPLCLRWRRASQPPPEASGSQHRRQDRRARRWRSIGSWFDAGSGQVRRQQCLGFGGISSGTRLPNTVHRRPALRRCCSTVRSLRNDNW